MKKILCMLMILFMAAGSMRTLSAEEGQETGGTEILPSDTYEEILEKLGGEDSEEYQNYLLSLDAGEWRHFQERKRDAYSLKEETPKEKVMLKGNGRKLLGTTINYETDGLQSGVFSEGEGVSNDDPKYVYKHDTQEQNLLFEGKVNDTCTRLNIEPNVDNSVNRFILWAPNWGKYYDEQVGAEIIMDRLVQHKQHQFMFSCMGRPFDIYLENSLQTMITVYFYRNVDKTKKVPNGEKIVFDTSCEHLLFSADGLTNETDHSDSIEYSAPVDPASEVFTSIAPQDFGTGTHNGRTVYYHKQAKHNVDVTYEMKGKDKAEIYVGILGNDDGTMWFQIGFTSFGLLPQAYLLTLDPNGGKLNSEASYERSEGSVIEIADPSRDFYDFQGWTFTKENGTLNGNTYTFGKGNASLKASWTPQSYPITYVLNGGENHRDNPSSYTVEDDIALKDPSREGYIFKGRKEGDRIPKGSSGEKTFTAEWEAAVYKIDYVLNGGTNNERNPHSYTSQDEVTIYPAVRKGYDFVKWEEGDHIPKGSAGDKTFTAVWKAEEYPITYILNGGKNDPGNPSVYTIEDEVTIQDASREGYAFKGWKEGDRIPKGSTGAKAFTAQWAAEEYPITYVLNGGGE